MKFCLIFILACVPPVTAAASPVNAVLTLDFEDDAEESHAAVAQVYEALDAGDRAHYVWYPGDPDFPPAARVAAVECFKRWLR